MKYMIALCLGFIILISCNNKSSQSAITVESESEVNEDTLFRVIDLANNIKPCSDPLLLSDIVSDVEYVKLETTDKALVGEMSHGYVSDSAIFYASYGNTVPPPHIFMFDRFTGKFIRTLGKSGQGPGEMHRPVGIVAKDSLVYISSTYRDNLYVYKIRNGEFVKCIPLNKRHTAAQCYHIDDNRVIHFPFYNIWDNGKYLMCDMSIQDFEGNIIKEQVPAIDYTGFDHRNRPNSTNQAISWAYKNHPNVYSDFTDTIYTAINDTIRPRYFISLGKYKRSPQLKVCAKWENYIIFYCFWETKEYLLGSFGLKQKAGFFRYDKKSKEIKTWEQDAEVFKGFPGGDYEWRVLYSAGITNDIDGCSYSLREMKYISENQFAICITQDNVDEIRKIVSESPDVKFPEKRKQLLDLIDSMGPDDNPILAIYKLKD